MTHLRLSVKRVYADVGGRQIHVRIARPEGDSDRPPVVCFHMSPHSGRIYEALLEDLGRDRMALAPDTPGFGSSDRPDAPPSIEDYADRMAEMLDALDIAGPVDLVGYHTGTLIALCMANRHPDRVRRVMTVSISVLTEAEREEFHQLYAPDPISEDGSHLAKIWQTYLHWYRQGGKTLEQAADSFPCRLLGRAEGWWGHNAAFEFLPEDWLPLTVQPFLILNTGDDLTDYTRRAAPLLKNGRVIEVPRWGHGFLDLHTADAARLARSYFDAPDSDPFGALDRGSGA